MKGEADVLDLCFNTDNTVDTGIGEQSHDGRVHSPPAGGRPCHGAGEHHSETTSRVEGGYPGSYVTAGKRYDAERTVDMTCVLHSHCCAIPGSTRAFGQSTERPEIGPQIGDMDDQPRGNHAKDNCTHGASSHCPP